MLFIRPILAFFGTRLGQYVLMAGMAVAAAVAFGAHERAIGYRQRDDKAIAERERDERAYLAILAKRMAAFAAITRKNAELTDALAESLRDRNDARLKLIAALKERIPAYVPENLRTCSVLPYGYLVFRANAADAANGRAASVPEPPAGTADAPTGVSLSTLAETDAEQASAYSACRDRVDGLDQYVKQVEQWVHDVDAALANEAAATP